MLSLKTLEAYFLKCAVEKADKYHGRPGPDGTTQWGGFDVDVFHHVEAFAEADGVTFLCPKCFEENKGSVGTHSIHIFFVGRNASDRVCTKHKGKPVRWAAAGTCLDDLVLTPSIQIIGGCSWHGFVGSNGVKPGHAQ